MTQRGPFYRGQSAIELAKSRSFESVAALLWNVDEASVFTAKPIAVPKEFRTLRKLLRGGPVDLASRQDRGRGARALVRPGDADGREWRLARRLGRLEG